MNHNLSDIEFSMVREVIASRLKLHFPIEVWNILRQRLGSAAAEFGFKDMNGFIDWLLSSELNKDQLKILISHLTISETYFWREPQVFTALTDYVLPGLIRLKKAEEKSIRIWSAGCSTGEEPYSIAIALHKTIPKITDWNISILATDINQKAIEKAETGVYGPWSFRNTPEWLRSRYFHHLEDRKDEIIPEIKKMVTFSTFNLSQENFLSTICKNQKMDIIFCRNVLMYFTDAWVSKISQNLFNSLTEGGWLIVSSYELSSNMFPQFTPVNFPGAVLYHKGKEEFSTSDIYSHDSHSQLFISSLPSFTPEKKVVKQLLISENPNNSALGKDGYDKMGTLIHTNTSLKETLEPQPQLKSREDILNENKVSIRLLASQGHLEEALSICNDAIESDKLELDLYFLRASILQELNKSHEAIKSLKQAIFIDPNYIIGHLTLGNLFKQQGNFKNAKRHFINALELLNTVPNDELSVEYDGFTVKYIKEIILDNLHTQKSI